MLSFHIWLLANFMQDFLAKPKCQDTNLRRKLDLFQKLKEPVCLGVYITQNGSFTNRDFGIVFG